MNLSSPLISVIIPFYNAAPYVAEALTSALNQSYANLEVIAVNDGSTDRSQSIVASFESQKVRCLHQDRQGTAVALNFGIMVAKGDFLAFLDADDYWEHNKLALQMRQLQMFPQLDFVLGQMQPFFSPELTLEECSRVHCSPSPIPGYVAGTMLLRRLTFDRVGPFSSQWRVGEYLDWYLRALECGARHRCTTDLVLMRRIHASNKGRVLIQAREDYLSIIRHSIARKKVMQGMIHEQSCIAKH